METIGRTIALASSAGGKGPGAHALWGTPHQLSACSHQWRAEVPPRSDVSKTFGQLLAVQRTMELATPLEEAIMDQLYKDVTFLDDVTGRVLDKAAAVTARKKEIQYFKEKGVYTKTRREPGMKIMVNKWF